jgi:3-deoxy-D-manno-octulosonic-acid transferase
VLIIDNIGMLSSLYKYGKVAYIGGGFGKGIHNVLEAAVFGIPVLFGPNHIRFGEAVDLIKSGGGVAILGYEELKSQLDFLYSQQDYRIKSGMIAQRFVQENRGASDKIISHILGSFF